MENPKISVIIPIYNAEKYLIKCIESVLSQTFTSFELLLIDDGSTDQSGNICDNYAKNDNRIHVYHRNNHGMCESRNFGLNLSIGEYVYFMDADDWIESTLLEKTYLLGTENLSDLVFLFQNDPLIFNIGVTYIYNKPTINDKNRFLLNNTAAAWQKIFRKDFLKNNELLFNKFNHIAEDQEMHFKVMCLAKRFAVVPEKLYNYRTDNVSATRVKKFNKNRFDIFLTHKEIKNFLEQNNSLQFFAYSMCKQMLSQEFNLYLFLETNKDKKRWTKEFNFILQKEENGFLQQEKLSMLYKFVLIDSGIKKSNILYQFCAHITISTYKILRIIYIQIKNLC